MIIIFIIYYILNLLITIYVCFIFYFPGTAAALFRLVPQKSKRATQIPEIVRTIDREGTIEVSA